GPRPTRPPWTRTARRRAAAGGAGPPLPDPLQHQKTEQQHCDGNPELGVAQHRGETRMGGGRHGASHVSSLTSAVARPLSWSVSALTPAATIALGAPLKTRR